MNHLRFVLRMCALAFPLAMVSSLGGCVLKGQHMRLIDRETPAFVIRDTRLLALFRRARVTTIWVTVYEQPDGRRYYPKVWEVKSMDPAGVPADGIVVRYPDPPKGFWQSHPRGHSPGPLSDDTGYRFAAAGRPQEPWSFYLGFKRNDPTFTVLPDSPRRE